MMAMILDPNKRYVQSWSGGKDSTCSIVLEHLHRDELGICRFQSRNRKIDQ